VAAFAAEGRAKLGDHRAREEVVARAAAGHREDFADVKLVLCGLGALPCEVLRGGHRGDRGGVTHGGEPSPGLSTGSALGPLDCGVSASRPRQPPRSRNRQGGYTDVHAEIEEVAGFDERPDPAVVRAALARFLSLPVTQRSAVILKNVLGHSLEETASTPATKTVFARW